MFPRVTVLTPNLPETEKLLGTGITDVEEAAAMLLAMGVHSVLIKGGHSEGDICRDYWTDGNQSMWLASPRVATTATHGTGCILSSAIASALALGRSIRESIVMAKTFLNQCLRSPAELGGGHGPMRIEPFRDEVNDRPVLQ